jgi:hypothetical protein
VGFNRVSRISHNLNTCILQAIGIALESRRLDIIEQLHENTHDTSLLVYSMEAVLDNHFPLSYRDQVLNFLYPLFPSPTVDSKSPYIHSLTRLLVTLSNPTLTVSLLVSLVPEEKLVAYQLAFDLVEGGAQDFLETIRNDLPGGNEVRLSFTPVFTRRHEDMIGPGHNAYFRYPAQDPRWTRICQALP